MSRATLLGTARPMPWKPPLRLLIAVFMPMAWPARLTSGPPLLPGLMAASVCKKSSYIARLMPLRPLPLMMPCVTEPARPNGAPTASTRSPISIWSLSPRGRWGRSLTPLRRMIAMSVLGSALKSRDVKRRPSWNSTVNSSAPATTWLLVRTMPLGSMTKPEPWPRRGVGSGIMSNGTWPGPPNSPKKRRMSPGAFWPPKPRPRNPCRTG